MMATLLELYTLQHSDELKKKIQAACVVTAYAILQETAGTNLEARQAWASSAIGSTKTSAERLLRYVLGKNSNLDVSTIIGASDTSILAAVNEAVDKEHGVNDG